MRVVGRERKRFSGTDGRLFLRCSAAGRHHRILAGAATFKLGAIKGECAELKTGAEISTQIAEKGRDDDAAFVAAAARAVFQWALDAAEEWVCEMGAGGGGD